MEVGALTHRDPVWPEVPGVHLLEDRVDHVNGELISVAPHRTGRVLSADGLRQLGLPTEVLADERGAPVWPKGAVGSISHTSDRCAVAVARADDYLAIGIDLERLQNVSDDVADAVSFPEERDACPLPLEVSSAIVLHSIREAVYKCWSPVTRLWLEHHQVRITWGTNPTHFSIRPAYCFEFDQLLLEMIGRVHTGSGFVRALVCLPRSAVPLRYWEQHDIAT